MQNKEKIIAEMFDRSKMNSRMRKRISCTPSMHATTVTWK